MTAIIREKIHLFGSSEKHKSSIKEPVAGFFALVKGLWELAARFGCPQSKRFGVSHREGRRRGTISLEVRLMGQIKCQVEECIFNARKICQADAIEVRSKGDNIVKSSDGTACETFRPKGLS